MSGFFATPKLPSSKLGGPVTGLFETCSKDPTFPLFPGIIIGQCNFLFNYWKEYLIENHSHILIQEEIIVTPTSIVITSNPMVKLSPLSPILEEMVSLSTPSMVASEITIEAFSTFWNCNRTPSLPLLKYSP